MRPIFVLMLLVLIIPEANAAYNYSISVGTHRVSFNASSPIWEITNPSPSVTDFGYQETYTPTYPIGNEDNPRYTSSSTTVTSRNNFGPSLVVEVRDFENPVPWHVMELEIQTIQRFVDFIPINGTVKGMCLFGNGIAIERNGESPGVIVDWPSDQVEIIIVGSLPSNETWLDIGRSLKLER